MAIVATHVAAVQELYVAYFGRPADPAGLDYWTNIVEAQGTTAAVSATFAASPEYIVTYFGKTNAEIVDQLYTNLFGRAADAAGKAYWVDLLNKGTIKVDTIVAEVAAAALTTDAEIIENKVAAATAFTAAVDTEAEIAGYAGIAALTAAKAFITGVTTDASLATAIAPAALNATVAAVVKAGTPFTIEAGLAALKAANDDLDTFLEDNELSADPAVAEGELDDAVDDAVTAIDGIVTGYEAETSPAVRAAMLSDKQTALNTALTNAKKTLVNANADAAEVTGLTAAIANKRAAIEAAELADEANDAAQIEFGIAANAFEARNATTLTVDPTLTTAGDVVASATIDGVAVDLIVVNARGNLVLGTGVTEAKYAGVTALRDNLIAAIDAQEELGLANDAAADASTEAILVDADNAPLVAAVEAAYTGVETAQDNVDALADAVADLADANAQVKTFDALVKAVTAAEDAFGANGFADPVVMDNASYAATSGSDIFTLGDEAEVTISAFGRSGSDSLFIGKGFTVNAGDLEDGDDTALEVFFVQNGTRTEVHVEDKVYGSDSGDITVITLIGVNADDLQLVDGIISLKAPTA